MKVKDKDWGNVSPSFVKALKSIVREEPVEEEPKKISEMLEDIAGEICDNYCKYAAVYADKDESFLWDEICDKCPLMRMI